MSYEDKIIYGFSDIKIKKDDVEYPILGAISCSVKMSIASATATSSNRSFKWSKINEVKGEMEVLNLTQQEQELLFGYELNGNELAVGDLNTTEVELSFKTEMANGKSIVYKMFVVFELTDVVTANTKTDSIEEETITLNFNVIKKDGIYYRQIQN